MANGSRWRFSTRRAHVALVTSAPTLVPHPTLRRFPLPMSRRVLDMRGVTFAEVLADHQAGDPSPWWAHVWPCGLALADRVLVGPRLDGVDCLDLGTGAGAVGIAAGLAGAHVTFADASDAALDLARQNATGNGLTSFELLRMDFAAPPPRTFARIYASDVLYVPTHCDLVIGALRALLAPAGVAYLADPRRQPVPRLFGAAQDAGMLAEKVEVAEEFLLVRLTHA